MSKDHLDAEGDTVRERRGFPRYPALDNTSQVGWWQDGRLHTSAAQLMDVSREGLLVLVDAEPPKGAPVLIRLIQPTLTRWVVADVAESRTIRQGPCQLRLVFQGSPAGFFALAASRCEAMN